MEALQQQIAQLVTQMGQIQAQMGQPAPTPSVVRRCPVAVPDKFSGDEAMFPAFLGQCQLFMALRQEDFPREMDKVGFIISLLSGNAARWATPLLTQNSPLLQDYGGFCQHLSEMFGDPIKAQTASRKLRELKQGRRPLRDYISEFRIISQDSAWNEAALLDAFQDGLSETLQDELARTECPSTTSELVKLCLRIDARMQSRASRRAARPPSVSASEDRVSSPTPVPQTLQVPVPSYPVALPRAEPMDLSAVRPRLTSVERERRRAGGFCFYCGQPGHFANACLRKRQPGPAPAAPVPPKPSGNGRGPV